MKIGLALGSGSSRGWSHIGIINELEKIGIVPNIVCGTSIGALVGAAYVSKNLSKLKSWVDTMTKFEMAKFYNINPSVNGLVNIDRLKTYLHQYVVAEDQLIENIEIKFSTVATDLETGREIWLQEGSVLESILSSIALPGIFAPHRNNGKWLVDGGLVNPVPVSTCRALGADIVIAVNLNSDIVGKHINQSVASKHNSEEKKSNFGSVFQQYKKSLFPESEASIKTPSYFDTIAGAINIFQDRITKSRMVGDPPEILLSPKLSHISLFDFHKANDAIIAGQASVKKASSDFEYYFNK